MTKAQATERLRSAGLTWGSPAVDVYDELVELASELGKSDPHRVADAMTWPNLHSTTDSTTEKKI